MSRVDQLPLALRFPVERRFAGFLPADAAEPALLRKVVEQGERAIVYGPPGAGKTHLLMACAAFAGEEERQAAYLPLATLAGQAVDALSAQQPVDVICIDDLDVGLEVAGVEDAVFALHNRQGDAGGALIYAAQQAPDALPIRLPDLQSRLAHCLRLPLRPLDEEQRRTLLVQRAKARGMTLEAAALDYLFRRVDRDLGSLSALLDRLDRASLAAQRRLSVPFVRQVLDDSDRGLP